MGRDWQVWAADRVIWFAAGWAVSVAVVRIFELCWLWL